MKKKKEKRNIKPGNRTLSFFRAHLLVLEDGVHGDHDVPGDETPDVRLVDVEDDLGELLEDLVLEAHHVHLLRDGLQEDEGGLPEHGAGGGKEDEDGDEGDTWVDVLDLAVEGVLEDEDRGSDHTFVQIDV